MTPLQTSQEITALLPTDIIPHIPSSPQTHPPLSYLQKHGVRQSANALRPSHLKYMTHKGPGEYLSLCLKTPQFVFLIPEDLWGGFVFMERIALQLPVSIPWFSDAHQSQNVWCVEIS